MYIFISLETSVLDPDLEIREGGTLRQGKGGGQSKKTTTSVWSKNGGGAGPPGPSPGSATKPSCLMGNALRLTQFHSKEDKIKFSMVKFDI